LEPCGACCRKSFYFFAPTAPSVEVNHFICLKKHMPIPIAIPLIMAAVSAAAGAVSGAQAAKKRRKMENLVQQQANENESWYNQNALQDYTRRADVQSLMRDMRENLYHRNRSAANAAVITGATPEQQAVTLEKNNKAMADAYSRIGAYGQQWKDRVTDRYQSRKDAFAAQNLGMLDSSAGSYENVMNSGLQSGINGLLSYLNTGG
jgi:hypothetical protein